MRLLSGDTLLVFLSDSHIGGDPGCDGFEAADELRELFEGLCRHEGSVELVLAGDFFDFLQIGAVPEGSNRAEVTTSRPEYREMFGALRRLREREGVRVVYLPGNHDAEVWWNQEIRKTLKDAGLVDEFAYSYAAGFEVGGGRRIVYCEHGNQFDSENTVADYGDPLDTPLGHHVVMDFTRRVAPFGEVAKGLDLSEIKMVFPLSAIPVWVASRYFYNLVQSLMTRLLLPLVVLYVIYRLGAFAVALWLRNPVGFRDSYGEVLFVHDFFVGLIGFCVLMSVVFGIFAWFMRRSLRRSLRVMNIGGEQAHFDPAAAVNEKIETMLRTDSRMPMNDDVDPKKVDVFVSGHTHLPSLHEVERPGGGRCVVVNSGCWLRQLQPTKPHLHGPPVFVSRFVLTHVRVFVRDGNLEVELRKWPRPAEQRLNALERVLSRGRSCRQPEDGARPQVMESAVVR